MKIVAFPLSGTAYTNSFYTALENRGGNVIQGVFAGRWLLNNLAKNDVVHFHWPSLLYARQGNSKKLIRSFLRFVLLLSIISLKRVKIVWTAHNLLPHQACELPVLDIIARHIVIALAAHIYVHGEEAKKALATRFPRSWGKCVVIPHGNWLASYPAVPAREQALTALQLPKDSFVYLAFGHGTPYKNLEGLVRAFLRKQQTNHYLVIAGKFDDKTYLSKLINLANGNHRIRIDARFIPDHEVPTYFSACNVLCIPYKEILTSGSAMLALSFGKPVISIDKAFLRDIITGETGILIPQNNEDALVEALAEASMRRWSSDQIVSHCLKYTFDDAAAVVLNTVR